MEMRHPVWSAISLAIATHATLGASVGMADATAGPVDVAGLLRPILLRHPGVPALWGATVDRGRLANVGAAGVRRAGSTVPVTSGDLVHLGSDTKAMTAVAVAQLVQAHQLAWTDTMAAVFPDLRADMDPVIAAVTVADLLRHTAGLPHDLPWGRIAGDSLQQQRLAAVRRALSAKPATPVGRFSYSNVGYVILGTILERKAGQSWERLMTDRVFCPLGMASAGFGPPGTAGKTDQPWGHHVVDGHLVAAQTDNPPVMAPAGGSIARCPTGGGSSASSATSRPTRG